MSWFMTPGMTAKRTGLGLMVSLVALSGCTPAAPRLSDAAAASRSAPSVPSVPSTGPVPGASSTSAPAPDPAGGTSSTSEPPPGSGSGTPTATVTPTDSGGTSPSPRDGVVSETLTHDWAWPGPTAPFKTTHNNPVPLGPPPAEPLPTLARITAEDHTADTPGFDQLAFQFGGAFPSYDISFVTELRADGSGLPVPMPGAAEILKVVFRGAQGHTSDGMPSVPTGSPTPSAGRRVLTGYVAAGDFEGVLSYGIGVGRLVTPPPTPAPRTKVRVYEVEKIEQGRHLYEVRIQLDASTWK